MSEEERRKVAGGMCAAESEQAWIEMVLLGFTDLLIVSKTTGFTVLSQAMIMGRGKTFCKNYLSGSKLAWYCHAQGGYGGTKVNLFPVLLNSTGQATA